MKSKDIKDGLISIAALVVLLSFVLFLSNNLNVEMLVSIFRGFISTVGAIVLIIYATGKVPKRYKVSEGLGILIILIFIFPLVSSALWHGSGWILRALM